MGTFAHSDSLEDKRSRAHPNMILDDNRSIMVGERYKVVGAGLDNGVTRDVDIVADPQSAPPVQSAKSADHAIIAQAYVGEGLQIALPENARVSSDLHAGQSENECPHGEDWYPLNNLVNDKSIPEGPG
jgi:hypothetical protein